MCLQRYTSLQQHRADQNPPVNVTSCNSSSHHCLEVSVCPRYWGTVLSTYYTRGATIIIGYTCLGAFRTFQTVEKLQLQCRKAYIILYKYLDALNILWYRLNCTTSVATSIEHLDILRSHKMISFVIQIALIVLVVYIVRRKKSPLAEIPGPKSYPIVGNVLQLKMDKIFLQMTDFAKQYGGIYKMYLFSTPVVVVNDERFIHEVLVKQSGNFAGHSHSYRSQLMLGDYSDIFFTNPGPELTGRRKALHTYLKQFGTGIQRLEEVTQTATDDLITRLTEQHGSPIHATDFLVNCVTDVVAILLVGETLSKEAIESIKVTFDSNSDLIGPGPGMLLDWFPFLRFFGNKTYDQMQRNISYINELIGGWKDQKPSEGFINFMATMSEKDKKTYCLDSEQSQIFTSWGFLSAGIATTTTTLNCLMNVLCHYPDVQEKLRKEVMDVIGPARQPTLKDQSHMPYLRATILEIGRFASVIPFTLPHKAVRTCHLDAYTIP